ncbi:MAG: radical SAM protein [Candidatus Aminicenantes bacterium]|nr:radical SAM protein [Candidatus Aminicenantes bacterium]
MMSGQQVVFLSSDPEVLWKNRKPLLRSLDIELTERCNNNCIHCCINRPENDARSKERELITGEWETVIDEAAALGALNIRFTGGEPLLRDDFADLYLYARHRGFRVIVFTNARLITPRIAELWARVPPLQKIEVTVYGMKPESCAAVTRNNDAFAEARRGMDLLLNHGIPFIVKGTVFPPTLPEMEDFIAWASRLPGMDSSPDFPLFLDLRHRRDSEEKNRHIGALRLSPEEGLRILTRDPDAYRRGRMELIRRLPSAPDDKIFTCNSHNAICIDAYGKIQYCLALRHPKTVLDIRRNTLKEMVTEFIPRLREMKSTNPVYLGRCGRCFLRGFCEQCPAKSWIEDGALDQPVDTLCRAAHEQAVFLGILKRGEKAWDIKDGRDRICFLEKSFSNRI